MTSTLLVVGDMGYIYEKSDDCLSDGDSFFPDVIQEKIDAGMGCGSSLPAGWLTLMMDIHKILMRTDPDYKIDQIKEKFGGLRFYTSGVTSAEGQLAIDNGESASYTTCEQCGGPGKLRDGRWIRTLCDRCA